MNDCLERGPQLGLGIVLWVLVGWRFTLGKLVLGTVMILCSGDSITGGCRSPFRA